MNAAVKGVRRITQTLDYIAQVQTAPSSRDLIDHIAIPRASGYDLLGCLRDERFLERRVDRSWALGHAIHVLAMSRLGLGQIAEDVVPVLAALQESTQETAQLVVLCNGRVRVTHVYSSRQSLPLASEPGTEVPLNWTAAGRVLASNLNERALSTFLKAHAHPPPNSYRSIDHRQLVQGVLDAKHRGYAADVEQACPGAASIAAPVSDQTGKCIAALSLLMPVEHMLNYRDTLVSLVQSAAAKLGRGLNAK